MQQMSVEEMIAIRNRWESYFKMARNNLNHVKHVEISKEDMDKIEEATTKAMKAAIDFVNTPFDKVMSMYNVKG